MANKSNTGDKKGSKKWKFNIIDWLVLAVVILGAAFLFLRVTGPAQSEDPLEGLEFEPYVIEYYCDTSFTYVTDLLEKGQRVTDDAVKQNLGALLDFELSDSVYWEPNESGVMVRTTRSDAKAVKLVTVCDACVNTNNGNTSGIRLYDGLALSVGHTLVVKVGDAKFYMAMSGFQKLSESPYAGMELPEYGHVA